MKWLSVAFLALVQPVCADCQPLRAAVAKIDITPPPGKYLLGSGEVLAVGTLDPLEARVLILQAGSKTIALVTLDLCRVFQAPLVADLRARARRSGIDYVLIAASHTHSGPIIPLNEEMPLDAMTSWQKEAVRQIGDVIDASAKRLEAVRMGVGYGSVYIGHNRRRVNPDGTVTMFFSNPTRVPTSPVDPTVGVVRIDKNDGRPLAILVNYACHPVVIMGRLTKYSADYPNFTRQTVERAFNGAPMCFFLQGAAGDIDTYYTGVRPEEDPVFKAKWEGERLGEEAAHVAQRIDAAEDREASIQFSEDALPFRWRWGAGKFEEVMRHVNPPKLLGYYMPLVRPTLEVPVATMLINRKLAIAALPGEPFVEFQMNFRDRSPVRDCLFLGYANGFFSYFPTIRAAAEGGHGGALWTRVEPGAGERMVDHALVKIYEMLGRLTDTPQPPRSR